MNQDENDPDSLQLNDELDVEWVNLWYKSVNKKNTTKKQITFAIIPTKNSIAQKSPRYSRKTL
jgi:hypothetical protein